MFTPIGEIDYCLRSNFAILPLNAVISVTQFKYGENQYDT